jgi:ATP-dependent RNA helicase DDX35
MNGVRERKQIMIERMVMSCFERVQRKRKDLRIIVSSATVDAEEFKEFFNSPTNWINPSLKESVAILSIEGIISQSSN